MDRRRETPVMRARPLVWALVLSLLLWGLAAVPVFAASALVCTDDPGPADGALASACAGYNLVPAGYLSGAAVVVTTLPGGSVEDSGTQRWYSVINIPADNSVVTYSAGVYSLTESGSAGFSAAPSGGDADEFDPADVDNATLAQMFAAGFSLVALAFIAGKGFELVLSMFK